ncbi:MAG: type II toxin-antitoxin system VapC family toxin [Ornithinimicrobium sp.]
MGVNYLLDTHVLLWLLGEPARVPHRVRLILADQSASLIVSAASAWEVATKTRLGKLNVLGLVESWAGHVEGLGAGQIAIETADALLAGSIAWKHGDPFDRMLAAQAIRRDLALVTNDPALVRLEGLRTLSW